MTIREAKKILEEHYYKKSKYSEEDVFLFTEAFDYLIKKTNDSEYMAEIGSYYYAQKDFQLAKKYYEMAVLAGNVWANDGLGYIYYYGRVGEPDYKKAFEYFSKAKEGGITEAAYKVADMYKNGYGVEQNYDKYVEIIEELYEDQKFGRAYPGLYTRLAKIRSKQGRVQEAIDLYLIAKEILAERELSYNSFFGDINVMKWLIEDLYRLRKFNYKNFDLFDCFAILKEVKGISFMYDEARYEIMFDKTETGVNVKFLDKWYRSFEEMLAKATLDGDVFVTKNLELYDFEVLNG